MLFHSLSDPRICREAATAVVEGLAPDKGLYFPEHIPRLPMDFWLSEEDMAPWNLGVEMMAPFFGGALSHDELAPLLKDVLSFPLELHELEDGVYALELFHGPTHAFKDVGARFLSRMLSKVSDTRLTILVATSGDTGSAVAQGFLGVPNIDVVILYPQGRISKIQEQQLTTAGSNIQALEVQGAFDDCQAMVKAAFMDSELKSQRPLTSANSINIARWLPQSIYYAWATHLLGEPIQFSVPSGNVGNLSAGLLAANMGMPCEGFVAATNANDGLTNHLQGGNFQPRPSVPTISNAMDVGDPSNLPRLLALCGGDLSELRAMVKGHAISDDQTQEMMRSVCDATGYLMCPHTAVGYAGLMAHRKPGVPGVVLATAHPAKFSEVVKEATGVEPPMPDHLKECLSRPKKAMVIEASYEALKAFLLS
ncbi:MAG: threonine synthase [Bacteroidetes bacterium]|nr:threonine synthase [Bacteroidota bacterium]MDA0903087.1 threonine synthase [Bacteroidota bacterium]MDA1241703.1 threonine synthase [Bacteroidota bacterium]